MLFLTFIVIWLPAARKRTFEAGCFALPTIEPEIARTVTIVGSAHRSTRKRNWSLNEKTSERAVLDKEKFQQVVRAIRLLSASEQECLLLRAEGLRYREIGEVLGISISTVSDTVSRAIKKLAEKFNV